MKCYWREILLRYKEKCMRQGSNYLTLTKKVMYSPLTVPGLKISVRYQYRDSTGTPTWHKRFFFYISEFPKLLKLLMAKGYRQAIHCGFEATCLFLLKLQTEDREVNPKVHGRYSTI
jgi:hypothetical protein